MTRIIETVPNDAEIEAMAHPKNQNKLRMLEQKRAAKRRLDDLLEQMQLQRAIGADSEYY